MIYRLYRFFRCVALMAALLLAVTTASWAQGTAFTYQSRLNDNGALANGNYDLQFSLFDALNGGAQIGATLNKPGVAIANGVFIVQLDFGASAFINGAQRFLQIAVRAAGTSDPYTTLSPRTEITSTPHAIRSLSAATADNAIKLNGTNASQYVQTNDLRLSDARDPKPGSTSYIQNISIPQAGNFNVTGNGTLGGTLTAGSINTNSQFNLGGERFLSGSSSRQNLFVGAEAGRINSTGSGNTFVGQGAGYNNATEFGNTFVGTLAGTVMLGSRNTMIGSYPALSVATTGSNNTGLGSGIEFAENSNYATAIGSGARALCSNCVVLGQASTDVHWGLSRLLADQGGSLELGGNNNVSGAGTPYIDFHFRGAQQDYNVRLINYQNGKLQLVGQLDVTGQVCGANLICTSDARLKEQVKTLNYGLPDLLKLRPVSWQWKDRTNKQLSIGMIAQDVEKVMPELLLRDPNPDGPLGLNYVGFVPIIIKAVQEQQALLEQKDAALKALQQDNAALNARLDAVAQMLQQMQAQQAAANPALKPQQ